MKYDVYIYCLHVLSPVNYLLVEVTSISHCLSNISLC